MYNNSRPMCQEDDDYGWDEPGDKEESYQQGFLVTSYSDGSSTVNFGPMGGKVNYDKFGNEC